MARFRCSFCGKPVTSKINAKEGFATILCHDCGCLVVYGTFTVIDEITHFRFIPKDEYDKSYGIKREIEKNPFMTLKE